MRELSENIKNTNITASQVHYNYEINLANNQTILLTSKSIPVTLEDKLFSPYSGISFKQGHFNDCANDYVILEGIYEKNGIEKNTNLEGAKIKIWRETMHQKFYHLVTLYCTAFTKYDLKFQIKLEPEAIKFNQSLLQCFSKTCRANFGDEKCGINKANYSYNYNILEINDRNFVLSPTDKENGYFAGGEAIIGNEIFKARIVSHFRNIVEVDRPVPENVKNYSEINLIAGCDKKFITCCNKFYNAVNFRGEPFIPKNDFLQIS